MHWKDGQMLLAGQKWWLFGFPCSSSQKTEQNLIVLDIQRKVALNCINDLFISDYAIIVTESEVTSTRKRNKNIKIPNTIGLQDTHMSL